MADLPFNNFKTKSPEPPGVSIRPSLNHQLQANYFIVFSPTPT